MVLAHTACGAVKGACDHAKMGNLTGLLHKIEPAVRAVKEPQEESERTSRNLDFVNEVAAKNVELTIQNIKYLSPILKEMEENGDITIVGGMYHIEEGRVEFYS
jgi:carbonic anhydrase